MSATNQAATGEPVAERAAPAGSQSSPSDASELPRMASRRAKGSFGTATRLVGQATFVYGVFLVASRLVQVLHLPLPASLAGVLILLLLLIAGVVTPEQMQELSDLISAHLAFFFIPLVVMGLLSWGGVLLRFWAALSAALLVSAIVGIATSGVSAQAVQAFRRKRGAPPCKP